MITALGCDPPLGNSPTERTQTSRIKAQTHSTWTRTLTDFQRARTTPSKTRPTKETNYQLRTMTSPRTDDRERRNKQQQTSDATRQHGTGSSNVQMNCREHDNKHQLKDTHTGQKHNECLDSPNLTSTRGLQQMLLNPIAPSENANCHLTYPALLFLTCPLNPVRPSPPTSPLFQPATTTQLNPTKPDMLQEPHTAPRANRRQRGRLVAHGSTPELPQRDKPKGLATGAQQIRKVAGADSETLSSTKQTNCNHNGSHSTPRHAQQR